MEMSKSQLVDAIMTCHHRISGLRIAIAMDKSKGSNWAEESRKAMIAEYEYAITYFTRELEKVGA